MIHTIDHPIAQLKERFTLRCDQCNFQGLLSEFIAQDNTLICPREDEHSGMGKVQPDYKEALKSAYFVMNYGTKKIDLSVPVHHNEGMINASNQTTKEYPAETLMKLYKAMEEGLEKLEMNIEEEIVHDALLETNYGAFLFRVSNGNDSELAQEAYDILNDLSSDLLNDALERVMWDRGFMRRPKTDA